MRDRLSERQWTAYVLGELKPGERQWAERILAGSQPARERVAGIREAAECLTAGLVEDPRFRLTDEQRSSVLGRESPSSSEGGSGSVVSTLSGESSELAEYRRGSASPIILRVAAVILVLGMAGAYWLGEWKLGDSDEPPEAAAFAGNDDAGGFSEAREQADRGGATPGDSERAISNPTGQTFRSMTHSPRDSRGPDGWHPMNPIPSASVSGATSRSGSSRSFIAAADQPVAHCSVEIDSLAYESVRQSIWNGRIPLADAVQVDDMVNYFTFQFGQSPRNQGLQLHLEATTCPWNARHRLIHVGLKGGDPYSGSVRPARFILIVDGTEMRRSGFDRSMLLQSLLALRSGMKANDVMFLVDGSRFDAEILQLEDHENLSEVLERVSEVPPGGADIGMSHQWLRAKVLENLDRDARNEIVLVLGNSERFRAQERTRVLEGLHRTGDDRVRCSILGIGSFLGEWADEGLVLGREPILWRPVTSVAQANHFWQEILERRAPVLAEEVIMQIEFNPETVWAYRRVGHGVGGEARGPGGEPIQGGASLRAGQQVSSLFEVVPARAFSDSSLAKARPLHRGERSQVRTQNMLTVKLNYRLVSDNQRVREVVPFVDAGRTLAQASEDLKFSASVAAYGMLLSDAPFRGTINHYGILELAEEGLGSDSKGYRREFVDLVKRTVRLILRRGERVSG